MQLRDKFLFFTTNIILSICIFISAPSQAQGEEYGENHSKQNIEIRKLDERKWKTITRDLDYNDQAISRKNKKRDIKQGEGFDDDAERISEFEEREESDGEYDFESTSGSSTIFNLGSTGQVIMYALAVLLIAFILYKLIGGNLFSGSNNKDSSVKLNDFLEEEIHESDLERHLKDALSRKDYKLAIRIYYLMILKELSLRNWIQWRKEKTNKEYLYEMSSRTDYRSFFETTRLFEKVWYGDSEINESEYTAISPVFKSFVEGIKSKES